MTRLRAFRGAVARLLWTLRVLVSSGMIAAMRPDKYLRQAAVIRRQGTNAMTGISLSAVRSPKATALVDERGSLTWRELDRRSDAAAVALQELLGDRSGTLGILCRNHRGLVESLAAASRIGADALLLNTGFSAPQLGDVLEREHASLVVYDEEFAPLLEEARSRVDGLVEVVAWQDDPADSPGTAHTLDVLIEQHLGQKPGPAPAPGRTVLLTSGTTGTPKGARRSGGGPGSLAAMLERIPWRAGETTVVAAPMFHAWGFGQLAISASMGCTVVMRRKFDPEAILELVDQHEATGLAVVPVMLERIIDLPAGAARPAQPAVAAVRDRERLADASRRSHQVHGPVRRRGAQLLQRHRGRADQHRHAARPPGGPRVRRTTGGGHGPADHRRRGQRGAGR